MVSILLGLIGAALVVVAGSRTWAHVSLPDLGGMNNLPLSGRQAAPTAIPIALAAGAGVIVMATAGRAIRFPVAAALVAAGALVGVASHDARHSAVSSAAKAMESAIGMANQKSVIKLPGDVLANASAELTIWPLLGILGGVLIALSGLAGLLTGASWPGPASRFEAATPGTSAGAGPAAPDDARTWDALSRGDDPT
jgi:hypothetical protein